MIDLNLLSPERQKALYGRVLFSNIERLMISIVTLVLGATITLLGIKIKLTQNLTDIQSRQVLSTEYVAVNNQIKDLNSSIKVIETLQKDFVPASLLIQDISDRTPPGVTIGFLSFETKGKTMRIFGHADTRDQLLSFEAALLDSTYIEKLESPISNLFEKTNLDFEFRGILDTDELKNQLNPES